MLRRAVLSMLLGCTPERTVTSETVALIDTPDYLKTELTLAVVQEFEDLNAGQALPLEVSTEFAFSISWSPLPDLAAETGLADSASSAAEKNLASGSGLQVGASDISLGLHANGFLYIGAIQDSRAFSFEKLRQGFKLKLEVNPQPGELTHTKLTLTDAAGLTLALVKNRQYARQAWKGNILLSGMPLKHFKIEGRSIKQEE